MGYKGDFSNGFSKLAEFAQNTPSLVAMRMVRQYGNPNIGPIEQRPQHQPTAPTQGTPDGVGGRGQGGASDPRMQAAQAKQNRNAQASAQGKRMPKKGKGLLAPEMYE